MSYALKVTIDGPSGAGKTTLAASIAQSLKDLGYNVTMPRDVAVIVKGGVRTDEARCGETTVHIFEAIR